MRNYKYLGHYLCEDLSDNMDIMRQISYNYAKGNMLARNFTFCSDNVKCVLFKTFMYNMYTVSLWCSFTQATYKKMAVSYNNVFRYLFSLPSYCSASTMFVSHKVQSFQETLRKTIYSLMQRIYASDNKLIGAYIDSKMTASSLLLDRWKLLIY